MTLPFFFEALRRRIALILIVILVVTAAGLTAGKAWPKTYSSSAQILLGLEVDDDIDAQSGNLYLKERVATYAQTVKADEIVDPVATAADISADLLRSHISVSIVPETVVLEISVSASTPQQAVELTNAVSRRFQSQVSALNVETGGPEIVAAQFSSPQPATEPDQLHGALLVGVSGLAGLVLGILLALLLGAVQAVRESEAQRLIGSNANGSDDRDDKDDLDWRVNTDHSVPPAGADGRRPTTAVSPAPASPAPNAAHWHDSSPAHA